MISRIAALLSLWAKVLLAVDDGSWDSETLLPDQSFSVTFDGSGTFLYFCEIHPFLRGTVTVSGDDKGGFAEASTDDTLARAGGF